MLLKVGLLSELEATLAALEWSLFDTGRLVLFEGRLVREYLDTPNALQRLGNEVGGERGVLHVAGATPEAVRIGHLTFGAA